MDYAPEKIRNVLLAGHSSAGKTSLAEALLYINKATDRLGSVASGTSVMDFEEEEIRRKASVSLACSPFECRGCKVNLFDAPGLFEFELGEYEAIQAVENVCAVLPAKGSIPVGAEKAARLAVKNGRPLMFAITNTKTENADFLKTFNALREKYGKAVFPLLIPVIKFGQPTVYVDMIDDRAFVYEDGKRVETQMPEEDFLFELREEAIESIAETDDALMEKFFAGTPFTNEEKEAALKGGAKQGIIYPVVGCDSLALECVDYVARCITNVMASPVDISIHKDAEGNEVPVTADGPLAAYVFKTVADPFVGKLSYVKVISGKLTAATQAVVASTGELERPGKLLSVKGKKQVDVKEICAGDIGAVTKLQFTHTGDTLCEAGHIVSIQPGNFPKPTLSMAVFAAKKGEEGKISQGIQKLLEEDRTVTFEVDKNTKEQILSGLGEQHLEVVIGKLKSKFGCEVALKKPRIAYRETIRGKAEAEGKHKKQSGGAGQFGVVEMRFEPLPGEQFEFVNAVVGGAVPKEFIPAVEKGIREAKEHGVLAGYPMVGFRATLYDGKYHPVDSKEVAFKSAARISYKTACAQANPCILEPIMTLKAWVPQSVTGDIMGEVTKRRGRVNGMTPDEDDLTLVEGEIPMAEAQDFTAYIRSVTQGRGTFALEFLRYDPLPGNLEAKVIADAADLRTAEPEE